MQQQSSIFSHVALLIVQHCVLLNRILIQDERSFLLPVTGADSRRASADGAQPAVCPHEVHLQQSSQKSSLASAVSWYHAIAGAASLKCAQGLRAACAESVCPMQLLLRHGRLKMHRSQHPISINSGGLWVVNNGLVKVTYTPNFGAEQQYFLGSGDQGSSLWTVGQVVGRCTMRFGSTAKVLLKCKLKYYRISE